MEIALQGKSTYGLYGLPGWDGLVEVGSLQLYQMKRLTGSRDVPALFRKILKIMKEQRAPVRLPVIPMAAAPAARSPVPTAELAPMLLDPDCLDIGDFMQLVVGMVAASRGRQMQKTYTCPACKKEQPRVLDVLKILIPKKPDLEGGETKVKWKEKDFTCRNVRIRDFLEVHKIADAFLDASRRWVNGRSVLSMDFARKLWGDVASFEDEVDLSDFHTQLVEVGMTAARVECGFDNVVDRIKWMLALRGDAIELFSLLSSAVDSLSASMLNEYETPCTDCGEVIKDELGAEDYFFGSRWTSLTASNSI